MENKMGWYRLSRPKDILAFLIDGLGYIFCGPVIFILAWSIRRRPFVPAKILLLRLDHMGDVLMATPAIMALKRYFPQAKIYLAIKSSLREVVSLPGLIEKIITMTPPWTASPREESESLRCLVKKNWQLRQERFDLGIDLKGDLRNIVLLTLAGCRQRLSYEIRGGGFLLTRRVPFYPGKRHEIDRNLDLVRALGAKTDKRRPGYEVLPEAVEKVRREFGSIFTAGEKLVGLHPGANSFAKIWPPANYAKLIDKIEGEKLARVIIFGGPQEKKIMAFLKASLKSPVFMVENLSLPILAAFLKELDLFIGNDSGPFHLAEAVGTAVAVIFGSTFPEIVGPVAEESIIIKSRRPCAPCRQPGEKEKCREAECLREVPVEEVYQSIRQRLTA